MQLSIHYQHSIHDTVLGGLSHSGIPLELQDRASCVNDRFKDVLSRHEFKALHRSHVIGSMYGSKTTMDDHISRTLQTMHLKASIFVGVASVCHKAGLFY
jgi:hypothetical protein